MFIIMVIGYLIFVVLVFFYINISFKCNNNEIDSFRIKYLLLVKWNVVFVLCWKRQLCYRNMYSEFFIVNTVRSLLLCFVWNHVILKRKSKSRCDIATKILKEIMRDMIKKYDCRGLYQVGNLKAEIKACILNKNSEWCSMQVSRLGTALTMWYTFFNFVLNHESLF